jgi:putative transposase
MKDLGNAERQEVGRWASNGVENSHLPFRRRERAMLRYRQMKTLQKFSSVHAAFHDHFNQDRHLISRDVQGPKSSRLGCVEDAPDRFCAPCPTRG